MGVYAIRHTLFLKSKIVLMAQIIKQPNGKYCMFSGVVDNITAYDMSRDDIVSFLLEKQKIEIENQVDKIIKKNRKW
jgi:hypothetical protein